MMSSLPEHSGLPGRDRVSRSFPYRFLLFGLMVVASALCGFLLFDANEAGLLVQRFGYYSMLGTFVWAVFAMVKVAPDWMRSWSLNRKEWLTVAGTIVGLTLIAVITVPYTYKVLYDEFVLQATAWCLHETREVGVLVRGYDIGGVFAPLQTYLDKRPIFFAFLVSLLHDLTGYREANAFALNTVLMPMSLGLVYLLARKVSSHLASLAAMVALGGFSLLAQNATGSGMEMINLVMLLLVMHLGLWYLEQPEGPRLSALVLCTVLLAQSRYESGLYVAPAAIVILEGWRRAGKLILPVAAILAPCLLIPYALHNTYLSGTPLLWELREGDSARFGAQYLSDNLYHAVVFFFSFSGKLTNSWWLGVVGIPALLWAGWAAAKAIPRWKQAAPANVLFVIFGSAITANLSLLMFYYWGQLDDAIVSRLSLPFSALLVISIAWAAMQFRRSWQRPVALVALSGALLSYLSSGLIGNAMHWTLNQQAREIAWEVEQVKARPPATRLILTNKSALIWLTNRISALQIVRARARGEQIKYHLDHHTFQEVLVMQTYRPVGTHGGFQLEPLDRLPDNFILEPLIERRVGTHAARISRLVRIDPVEEIEMVPAEADPEEPL